MSGAPRDVIVTVLSSAIIAGAMYIAGKIIGGGVGRSDSSITLRHSRRYRGVALLTLVFLPVVGFVWINDSAEVPDSSYEWTMYIVGGVLTLLMLLGCVNVLRYALVMDSDGITIRSLLEGWKRNISWSDVRRISRRNLTEVAIEGTDSQLLVVSYELDGYPLFVKECRNRLRAEVYGTAFSDTNVKSA